MHVKLQKQRLFNIGREFQNSNSVPTEEFWMESFQISTKKKKSPTRRVDFLLPLKAVSCQGGSAGYNEVEMLSVTHLR